MPDDPTPEFADTGIVTKQRWEEAFALAWNEIKKDEPLNDHFMRILNTTYEFVLSGFPEDQKPQAKMDFFIGLPVLHRIIFHKTVDFGAQPA